MIWSDRVRWDHNQHDIRSLHKQTSYSIKSTIKSSHIGDITAKYEVRTFIDVELNQLTVSASLALHPAPSGYYCAIAFTITQ